MVHNWVSMDVELPPKDGFYYVTNHPDDAFDLGSCFYDGHGFLYDRIYRNVEYWSGPTLLEKKYGKQ